MAYASTKRHVSMLCGDFHCPSTSRQQHHRDEPQSARRCVLCCSVGRKLARRRTGFAPKLIHNTLASLTKRDMYLSSSLVVVVVEQNQCIFGLWRKVRLRRQQHVYVSSWTQTIVEICVWLLLNGACFGCWHDGVWLHTTQTNTTHNYMAFVLFKH